MPSLIVGGFLLLALATYVLDQAELALLEPAREFMAEHVFGDPESTGQLLGAIAASIITVTSITLSLLLLAVQQAAGAMTHAVVDQFLRRRFNQVFFGFFIGLAVYALLTLATVDTPFNPVIGASFALASTVITLTTLPLLIYKTIDQMRPVVITRSIHDLILSARERQLAVIGGTRQALGREGTHQIPVRVTEAGYVTRLDVDAIDDAIINSQGDVEVDIVVPIGGFVSFHDPVAVVHAQVADDAHTIAQVVSGALRIAEQRDLGIDPAYGIEQLHMIAWTSVSTSKSNPAPGIQVIRALRDILAKWTANERPRPADPTSHVIYRDNVVMQLLGTLESLAAVSTESMQHQCHAEVLEALAVLFERLPLSQQCRAAEVIMTSIAGLGDQLPTAVLDTALGRAAAALDAAAFGSEALAVRSAQEQLRATRGKFNSRSTRVPTG